MAEEAAVLEAPEIVEPVESMGEESPESEPIEGAESTEGEVPASTGEIWQKAKTAFREDADKKLIREIQNRLHRLDRLDKAHDGAPEKKLEQLQLISRLAEGRDEGLPPEEIVEQTVSELSGWRDFDSKFEKGDPAVVAEMYQANPDSFLRIVPAALNQFAEANPEGYASLITGVAMRSLDAMADLPRNFAILDAFIDQLPEGPATAQVQKAIRSIYAGIEKFRAHSSKPILPERQESKTGDGKTDDREAQLNQREQALRIKEWTSSASTSGNAMIVSEASRLAGAKKLTDSEIGEVKRLVADEVGVRLKADRKYGEAQTGYLKKGDRRSFEDRIRSEHKKLVPAATRRAVDEVLSKRKAAPAAAKADSQTKRTVVPRADQGEAFERIAGHPKTQGLKIDHERTTHAMLSKYKAYVVGKKNPVQWPEPKLS